MRTAQDPAVVITGASSGIGRATAIAFARTGANVALAARRAEALRDLAGECERLGGRTLALPTDVADPEAVRELADRTIAGFGRIDIWVNNAAVTVFGRFEETPPEAFRRVLETNLFGYVFGARAAIPQFREQGSGVLVNVASIVGRVGQPYTSAYVVSKWAIRGLSESLRQELLDANDIHVCTVLPASIDTPLFQHAANYTGRTVKPMAPVYDAEEVAEAILRLSRNPKREVLVGRAGRLVSWQHTLAPGLAERIVARQVDRDHFADIPAAPTAGNLFEPPRGTGAVSGGWRAGGERRGGRIALAALVAVPALAAWSWRRR